MPTASAVHQIGEHAHGLDGERQPKHADQQTRVCTVGVHPFVHRANGPFHAKPPQQRHGPGQRPPRRAREDGEGEQDRGHDERELDPEIRADVVFAERKREAHGGQGERGRASEGALEQHRAGDRPSPPRVAPGRLEDPRRVAAHGRRQHLPRGVADEVRPRQPTQPLVDRARLEQPLPAPRHGQHRHRHDRHRRRQPPVIRLGEDVDGLVEIDLPDDVGEAQARDDERRGDPHAAPLRHASLPVNRACTRNRASIASAMSSSEWAGESGSDSTSSPARSATGSGG